MTLPDQTDLINRSVRRDDVVRSHGDVPPLLYFAFPTWGRLPYQGPLPPELPTYWTPQRDFVLRGTILAEDFWGEAVAIAATKAAAMSFDIDSDVPLRRKRAQELMLQWDGQGGWVQSQEKGIQDFLCTDNGEFHQIVRASGAAGSKILGLLHLDSLRCLRTGDPDRPVVYRDILNRYHELRDYEVISLVDQPDPGTAWFGIGHCAAARSYHQIYKQAAVEQYLREKLTGGGATELEFVGGITEKQVTDAKNSAENQQSQRGAVYYQGKIVIPVMDDKGVTGYRVPLKSVPDGFARKEELDIALLSYANSIGLVLTDLQPLSGQGLGTGAQSIVLEEKAQGRGLAARRKQMTHHLNEWVHPDQTTFYFHETDLREEQQEAALSLTRAQTRQVQIQSGEINSDQARQLAVDKDDLPRDFLAKDQINTGTLGDEQKPATETETGAGAITQQPAAATIPLGAPKPPTARAPGASFAKEKGQQPSGDPYAKLRAAGLDLSELSGLWWSPAKECYFVSFGDWVETPAGQRERIVRQAFGNHVEFADETEGTPHDDGYLQVRRASATGKAQQPSQAQIAAGNYAKAHVKFAGLDVSIENKAGSTRTGQGRDGKTWSRPMHNDYGYIRRTEGVDGDHVDVYLGPNEKADTAYVVHQLKPDTGAYDEDKCMLGFDSEAAAKACYLKHVPTPNFFGAITPVPMSMFTEKVLARKGEPVVPDAARRATGKEADYLESALRLYAQMRKELDHG